MKKVYIVVGSDFIHHGHINIIKEARKLGKVIVGLLTDKAIMEIKSRPLLTYEQRKEIIENIKGVDEVIIQETRDYAPNLRKIKPDYVVHGDDWKTGALKKSRDRVIETLREWGGELIEVPYTMGVSLVVVNREPLFLRKTSISYKTEKKTVLRGYKLSDLAEEGYSFCDALFVLFQGRLPAENEEKMLEYETAEFLEHSMSPSAASAIAVISGRPDLPAAISAAVMTFGGAHGPGAAHGYMMNHYIERARKEGKILEEMGKILVEEHIKAGIPIMGLGQPQHTDGDPRAEPTHIKQEELGLSGVYLKLQRSIEKNFNEWRKKQGKSLVAVNMVGAGNTTLADLGFSPNAAWCIGCVCRGFSCAAHALYTLKKGHAWAASKREPMVQMLDLSMIKYVGPEDRPVPSLEERQVYALKQKEEGEYKKWAL